jgi:S-adenosylmethionine synthetase
MFGYATDETDELMPLPILLAHRLARTLAEQRKSGRVSWLRPDSKTQVSVLYGGDGPIEVTDVLVSTQHAHGVQREAIQDYIAREVVPIALGEWNTDAIRLIVNPSGSFVQGGPSADAGVTGRKIIVDTYGGMGRHGGGAFSGKDPSKVDRSGAYFCRYVARELVAAGHARRAEIQVAYAIGVAKPVSVFVDTFGTGKLPPEALETLVHDHFDLTPGGIIRTLDLLKPRYKATATHGHFGRKGDAFTWEKTDKADALREAAKKLSTTAPAKAEKVLA